MLVKRHLEQLAVQEEMFEKERTGSDPHVQGVLFHPSDVGNVALPGHSDRWQENPLPVKGSTELVEASIDTLWE